jgi:hypothetical protein
MPTIWDGQVLKVGEKETSTLTCSRKREEKECVMPYCITLHPGPMEGPPAGMPAGIAEGPLIVSARYGSMTQTMPDPFAKNCVTHSGTDGSQTRRWRKTDSNSRSHLNEKPFRER